LNLQQRENEKQEMKQGYKLLGSEIEKQKSLFTINQKEIQDKATLFTQLNNLNSSLPNQNIQNQITQKDLLSKLEQEELKLKQEAHDKQNIERQSQDLLIQMEKEKERFERDILE
jgi:hypothetical protein